MLLGPVGVQLGQKEVKLDISKVALIISQFDVVFVSEHCSQILFFCDDFIFLWGPAPVQEFSAFFQEPSKVRKQ